MFALVDCNNFYASCERVFRPDLIGKPVVVLSNNDGCVIARSNEAKLLGVPMGAVAYQYQDLFTANKINVFSSNYALYGDMSARIIVHAAPKPQSITTTTAICGSTQGTLNITPNYHPYGYIYNLNNGTTQADTVFSNLSAGHYTLTVVDSFACIYADTFSIKEVNLAKALFYPTPVSGCEPLSVYCANFSNNISNVTNGYVWYVNNDSATTQNLNYTFTDTGTHTITLLAYETLRRCSAITTQTVLVKDCPPDSIKITVPNIFSPNADGINDVWQLIVYNFNYTVNNYECLIYDRWGIKIFETNNINTAWDGKTTSGMPSSAGAYYYIIKLTATNSKGTSEQKDFKGYLELVR